jgi:hypothetical protein
LKSSEAWVRFGAVFIVSLGSPTNQLLTRLVNEVVLVAGGGVAGGGAVADAFACAPGGGIAADGGGAPAAPGGGCVGSVSEPPVKPVRYEQPVHAVSAMIPAMVLRKLPTPQRPRNPAVPEYAN